MSPEERYLVVASAAASFAKSLLEGGFYEKLEGQFGDRIRKIPSGKRKAIGAMLHFISGYIDTRLPDEGALHRFIKNILADAPSELGARFTNGYRHRRHTGLELSDLNEEEITAFLDWYEHASEQEQRVIEKLLRLKTAEELKKLINISPVLRDRLVSFMLGQEQERNHKPERKPLIPQRIGFIERWNAHIRGDGWRVA